MTTDAPTPDPSSTSEEFEHSQPSQSPESLTGFALFWDRIIRLGLGEVALRLGTGLATILLIVLVAWVMNSVYLNRDTSEEPEQEETAAAVAQITPTIAIEPPSIDAPYAYGAYSDGITRLADLHTNFPTRPRFEVSTYEVQEGDNLFSIAEKFNLKPETILWGNRSVLYDNPHNLMPGQILNILPVNGVYYEWHAGDGLNGVAEYFHTTAEEIVNYPGNHLDTETLGDWSYPNIEAGTWLIIPGGSDEFYSWSAPRITREDPAVASIMGPGSCAPISSGPIGTGTFVWPTTERYISGYTYSPSTNHYAIDIGGVEGNAIYASDSGVVVYAGWNDWGYGYTVVIDHGNGWQTLYAHLSTYNVGCGSYVYQGDVIAGLGTTGNSSGPHLHFEMRSDTYGRPNPLDYLN